MEMIDALLAVVPLVLVVAFVILLIRRRREMLLPVGGMKEAIAGIVVLFVALMIIFAFTGDGDGGGDDPGEDTMDPGLFTYKVTGSTATVTGWKTDAEPEPGYDLVFPRTDGHGHRVTAVAAVDVASDPNAQSPWKYAGTLSSSTVTTVGDYAFRYSSLTSVSLPAARTIGALAFTLNASLETVDLPAATSIGASAFDSCSALTTVSMPAVQSIGAYAFNQTHYVESVRFGPLTGILSADAFPHWTFYAVDGSTPLQPTAANLKNSSFEGTNSTALIKVPSRTAHLTPEMLQIAAELSESNERKAAALAAYDPELSDLDPYTVAAMTEDQVRDLTSEDVQALKQAVREAKYAALAEIDAELAFLGSEEVERLTLQDIRALTPQDVEKMKRSIPHKDSGGA